MKILIVDDDPHILDALTVGLQLQWQDCEVVTAAGGEAGEQAFFDHVPDVVLLDPALPDRSGYDVLRAIRRVSDVPVLILSARGAETDQVKGLELGADDYLVKPFGHLVLLARIKAVLRRAELPPPVNARPDFVAGDLAINFQSHQVTLRGEPVQADPGGVQAALPPGAQRRAPAAPPGPARPGVGRGRRGDDAPPEGLRQPPAGQAGAGGRRRPALHRDRAGRSATASRGPATSVQPRPRSHR